MKRILSCVLSFALVLSLVPAVFAANDEAQQAAQSLYELGLFQGTGTNANGTPNFDLDRTPTRAEAVTMLVRLLGKEEEAKNGKWTIPFTDVAEWAKPYVGYAYANGLTTGTSATTFGGNATVNASQYLTFVLRALGYESGTDFRWDKAWELSDQIGLTNGEYDANTTSFTRGDVAIVSRTALDSAPKGENVSLLNKLQGVTAYDLTGIWRDEEKKREVIFDGDTFTCAELSAYSYGDTLIEGTYKISGNNLTEHYTLTNTHRDYDVLGKDQYTSISLTWTFEFINENCFELSNKYRKYTYCRVSESQIIPQVKDELSYLLMNEDIPVIKDAFADALNALSSGSTNFLTASRYYVTATTATNSTTRAQAKKYESKYLLEANKQFVLAGTYIMEIGILAKSRDGAVYDDILAKCNQILPYITELVNLDSADLTSLQIVSDNSKQILNLSYELNDILNEAMQQ